MSVIRIDPQEVNGVGVKFDTKQSELEALRQESATMVNNLQGSWTGQRANRFFNDWAAMEPNLRTAIETLQQASQLLKQAANDFAVVDGQG